MEEPLSNQPCRVVEVPEQNFQDRRARSELSQFVKHLRLELEFTSRDFSPEALRRILRELLRDYTRASPTDILNLLLVIEEAVQNAHEHGNLELDSKWKEEMVEGHISRFEKEKYERLQPGKYAGRRLAIQFNFDQAAVRIDVSNEGPGFSAENVNRQSISKPYGRGLIIIKSLVDEVQFSDSGRCISLRKRLNQPRRKSSRPYQVHMNEARPCL